MLVHILMAGPVILGVFDSYDKAQAAMRKEDRPPYTMTIEYWAVG